MECHFVSIPKLQRCNRWSLGKDEKFHLILYRACDYLSMLGLKLNDVSERRTANCREIVAQKRLHIQKLRYFVEESKMWLFQRKLFTWHWMFKFCDELGDILWSDEKAFLSWPVEKLILKPLEPAFSDNTWKVICQPVNLSMYIPPSRFNLQA